MGIRDCSNCGAKNSLRIAGGRTKVVAGITRTWRRRKCKQCGERSSTVELPLEGVAPIVHTSIFDDREKFMQAALQTTNEFNSRQMAVYAQLLAEAYWDMKTEIRHGTRKGIAATTLQIIMHAIGVMHSLGADVNGCWKEMMRAETDKLDPATGKIRRDPDTGRVMKPNNWRPPLLDQYIKRFRVSGKRRKD